MSDAVLPFPVLLTTIVADVVSFMLILENQNTEQKHKQVKQSVVMMAATTVGMKRSHREADDDDGSGSGSTKWRMIQYSCNHVRRCIQPDYLGPSPIFIYCKFQQIFHVTQGIYDFIRAETEDHNFYNISDYDVTGHPTICINAKLLTALKHLGYGCATNVWIDYFQMGESTRCLCVEVFCKTIAQSTTLHE